jgi:hypothetical protein
LHDPDQLLDAAIDAARHGPNRVRHVGAVLVSADGPQGATVTSRTFSLRIR